MFKSANTVENTQYKEQQYFVIGKNSACQRWAHDWFFMSTRAR